MPKVQREHIIQGQAVKFVAAAVIPEHEMFAFDRSAGGVKQRAAEKRQGIRNGTPDTLVRVVEFAPIWCEFKQGREAPNDGQKRMGARLKALGDHWFWAATVVAYAEGLDAIGVPMRPGWRVMAQQYQARAESLIAKREVAVRKAPKREKPTPRFQFGKRALARAGKAGVRV